MDKRRIDSIYGEILDLPQDRRRERLTQLCRGDVELEREVRSLLDAAERPVAGFDAQFENIRNGYWRSVVGTTSGDEENLSGERIGIWQLEERVGRGGLATVYRAQRADGTFAQRAAFKVMRRGLDTGDLISRFHAEREILAALDHPGIASILDGGALADGRPYLVLEFVDGIDIVEYAQQHNLDVRARLRLVRDVAAALHHAHQHLVVHRDVKPSNVMVTGEGAVRLLDFGIAKILDPSMLPIAARLTRTGIAVMTPAYGSPEQAHGEPVTTGSDVYQLGLLMAEVLTGARPEKGKAPRPAVATLRDRDLVAIIEKATRPEPNDRYASMRELEADIDRYLTNLPVLARAGSWRYRAAKFLRRRPLLVPAAAAIVIAVAIYIVTITTYSREVQRERTIAEKTQAFMIQLFESPDPRAPADPERGRSITVVEALDIGRAKILGESAEEPELEASLSRTLSSVYAALDQYGPAIELREQALRLEESLHGPDSSRALESMRALARLNATAGNIEAARAYTARQLEIARSMRNPGPELGYAEHLAAEQAHELGAGDDAAVLFENAIASLLAQDGMAERIDVDAVRALLADRGASGNPLEQILIAERIVLQAMGTDTPAALVMRSRVASSLYGIGEHAEAEARLLEVIPLMEAGLGANHPDTLSTRNNLGYLYAAMERHAEAEAVHTEVLARNLETFGAASQAAGNSYQNLAAAIARQGRYDEAIALHADALASYTAVFGESHYLTALPLLSSSYIRLQQQRPSEAEQAAEDALSRLEASQSTDYLAGIARCLIGTARYRRGDEGGLEVVAQARALMTDDRVPAAYAQLCGIDLR